MKLWNENELTFTQHVGSFKLDGFEKYGQIAITMNYSPIITFPDDTKVVFSWDDIIQIAQEFRNKQMKGGEQNENE